MAVTKKAAAKPQGMGRIRREKPIGSAADTDSVTISAIITKEQKRKLALHKADTGQSASDFIRECIDEKL